MQGTRARATAATGMNQRSSRSHAIFTITLEQRRRLAGGAAAGDESGEDEEGGDDYLCAKMHLVDLAGQPHGLASCVLIACHPCTRASRQAGRGAHFRDVEFGEAEKLLTLLAGSTFLKSWDHIHCCEHLDVKGGTLCDSARPALQAAKGRSGPRRRARG